MNKNLQPQSSEFLLYTTPDGNVHIDVFFKDETVWLTQKKMAGLFDVDVRTVSEHLQNIFETAELREESVIRKIRTTADDNKSYNTNFYNLDAIIAVGYRISSKRATQFRIWATQTLREYIIKGFAIDDERLKNGSHFGKDYFKELLERIRSIRASERRIYQQITDIFAECSVDYNPNSKITQQFFASVQNKFHYAITGETAAEIVHEKADAKKSNMGLKTWKHSPEGRILKSDTTIAKNYLDEKEIKKLERLISSYFDYLEHLVENHTTFKMEDLAESINKFLGFNEYKVLGNAGEISKTQSEQKAFKEYEKYNKIQCEKMESDFDKQVKKLLKKGKKN